MKAKNLGIFSAIFVYICCIGPLVLILLGLGTLGMGVVIGKYRWWFAEGGVLLIILAWRYYFKEKKSCNLNACQAENKKATQITLIVATIIVVFFVGSNLYVYLGKSNNTAPLLSSVNLESVVIPVEGMTCFTCEIMVSSSLKKINGVVKATASAKEGKAKVTYNPSKTNIKQLIEAINRTGYKASMPK